MLKKFTMVAMYALISACLPMTAQAIPFSAITQVIFFGDSLTDGGFNNLWPTVANPPTVPTLPVGKAPTFTTFGGYTWAQYIARDIKGYTLPIYPGPAPADTITNNAIETVPGFVSGTLTGINYAAAGSTTNSTGLGETWAPSLVQQVAFYLASAPQTLDPNAIFFLWSGANDLLTLINAAPPLPTQLQLLSTANTAAVNIANQVALLSSRGAKRIVVMSLPNIGLTPLATQLANAYNLPTLPASLQTVSFSFNSMLNTQLGAVIAQYGVKVLYVDTYNLINQVVIATQLGQPYVVAGQSFTFTNSGSAACSTVTSAIYCPSTAPNGYIFADTIHPTDMAHRVLSLSVESQIQNWQ